MAGFCITDDKVVCDAAKQEVIRRYYKALVREKNGEKVAVVIYGGFPVRFKMKRVYHVNVVEVGRCRLVCEVDGVL